MSSLKIPNSTPVLGGIVDLFVDKVEKLARRFEK
mgnify:CR=1 FL=1|jgi:hypothetical protein